MEPQQTATLLSNNLRVATAKVLGAAHNYSVEPSGENYSRLSEFLAEAEALRMDLCGVIDAIDSMHLIQIAACAAVPTEATKQGEVAA